MARRIKSFGGQQATVPIKDPNDLRALMNYFLIEKERAVTPKKKQQADRNWFMVLLGLNTAFRCEDLLQLRVIDLMKGYVSIKENKTGKMQNFRMNKELHNDVLAYIERNDLTKYDYLFFGQKNRNFPITRIQANRILKKAAVKIKLKQEISMHSLRKTFGYQYIKNGGNILTLMKMYNHDETSTTEIYICWGVDDAESDRSSIYLGGVHKKGK